MDSQRLGFWIEFIVSRSGFPSPQRLAAQFAVASFSEFCVCGCNSSKVSVPADAHIEPIATPSSHTGAVFESSFHLEPSNKSLEFILFADELGNLSYVEIDCNANSEAVPEVIQVRGEPYHVHRSQGLAP